MQQYACHKFWPHSEKQDGRHRNFSISFPHFSLPSFYCCVIATVLNFSEEISYDKRLFEKGIFGVYSCVCALAWQAKFTLAPL